MGLDKILNKIEHLFSVVYILLGTLVVFIAWALVFDIDETVRAQGKIAANGNSQIIQVADGGVLSKLLVTEGQSVKKGQLLATLEKARATAGYEEVKSQVAYLKAALARANAEILNTDIKFDKLTKDYPDFVNSQKALYIQKKRSLEQEVEILNTTLEISTEEWNLTSDLQKTGDVSQLEVLRARQRLLDIKRKIIDIKNKYYEKSSAEIEKFEGELAKTLHKLKGKESVLEYTDIRSPKSGIIKELQVTTVGGVLRAGEQLMEISPLQEGVILEAKINPMDIGRLKIGMPVSMKLDAFDYSIFGGLKGKVSYISSDTLLDKDSSGREVTFYKVDVKIDGVEHPENPKSKEIKVKLGMSATIDINVGRRSLFAYLTKPITRGFSGALNEQ